MCARKSSFRKTSFKLGFVILLVVFIGGCAELTEMPEMPFGINMEEILRRFHQTPSPNICQVTEALRVPLSSGMDAITTQNVYSGSTWLFVTGAGQASATSYTDAFYVFTDFEGVSKTPEHPEDWILAINGETADVYIPDGQIPAYNADHRYTFEINAPGGVLTFGVRDEYTVDNSGGYWITICRYSREGESIAEADMATQTAMVTSFPVTPTPSPMPQVTSTPLFRPTTTPAFSVGNPVTLESIHMLSDTQGWGTSGDSFLITRDGARTWHELPLPAAPEKYTEEYGSQVYFTATDADHAWLLYAPKPFQSINGCVASDAPVWYTTDGGQTWNASQPLMHQLVNKDCEATFITMDAQEGWMSIDSWYFEAGTHKDMQLFRTLDGGKTWGLFDATWCRHENKNTCFFTTPEWFSEKAFHGQTGWLLKNLYGSSLWIDNVLPPVYYVSTDGGEIWYYHNLPPPASGPSYRNLPQPTGTPYFYEQYFYCQPSDLNLLTENIVRLKLACSQGESNARPEAVDYIYASEDIGVTWKTYVLPVSSEEMDTRLKFFDPDYGLLLGRTIWRTEDAGKTWQEINSVAWDGQFSFVDRNHGWAIARSEDVTALVFTVNGGEIWEVIHPVIAAEE